MVGFFLISGADSRNGTGSFVITADTDGRLFAGNLTGEGVSVDQSFFYLR